MCRHPSVSPLAENMASAIEVSGEYFLISWKLDPTVNETHTGSVYLVPLMFVVS